MCIGVFIWQANPAYPFILLLNRDEYHSRLTKPLEWWDDGEILGGRDGVADGTWLGCTKQGKLAFLTNVRELKSLPQPKSRGHLPVRFLESKKDPMEFAEEVSRDAHLYNGFNLILADLCSQTMVYVTNRPKEGNTHTTQVSAGIHVLSNASLDTPWPKAQRLEHHFSNLLNIYVNGECPIREFAEKLMKNTVKDDERMLPSIYPPEWEYQLSSIYVEAETPKGRYGTRSTSVISVKTSGEVRFFESHLENNLWKEQTVTYHVENMK